MSNKKNKIITKDTGVVVPQRSMAEIARIEDAGTAMMQVSQQMFLATEEILKKEFNFNDEQLKHFEQKMQELVEALSYLEEGGLSIQTIKFMEEVSGMAGKIAKIRNQRLKQTRTQRAGIALPTDEEMKKLS